MKRETARVIADREEQVLSNLINQLYSNKSKNYSLFEYIIRLDPILKKENVIEVKHTGNDSKTLGDIAIYCENKIIFVETKFGRDTLANIGENSLTEAGLFNSITQNWTDFRESSGFNQKIIEILSPFNPDMLDLTKANIRADFVRALKIRLNISKNTEPVLIEICKKENDENKPLAEALLQIIELANQNKKDYINYLKNSEINRVNLKKFFNSISCGITPNKKVETETPYEFYYLTPKDVKKVDLSSYEAISEDLYSISFMENHLEISNGTETIKVVFHWKNVMQGIQTPCLNIFKK